MCVCASTVHLPVGVNTAQRAPGAVYVSTIHLAVGVSTAQHAAGAVTTHLVVGSEYCSACGCEYHSLRCVSEYHLAYCVCEYHSSCV